MRSSWTEPLVQPQSKTTTAAPRRGAESQNVKDVRMQECKLALYALVADRAASPAAERDDDRSAAPRRRSTKCQKCQDAEMQAGTLCDVV